MKKIILWSIVSAVIVGIALDAFLWLHKPQVITLNGGIKFTLLSVTYGKHHVAPKIKIAGGTARNGGARLDSTNDTLVVWIEEQHKPNQYLNYYRLLVYDKANTACVSTWPTVQSHIKNGVEIQGFTLDTYPRWDRKMILRFWGGGNGGQDVSKEQFVISNPARNKSFADWVPVPLPDTQSDGDLDVTLTKLVAAAPLPYIGGSGVPRNDSINKCVQIGFDIRQKGQSVTNWHPMQVETTDAAGNHINGWINNDRQYSRTGDPTAYFYQQGLWPGEPAWKLRLEFSRTSGFSGDEVWAVTNVPVMPGSQQDVWSDLYSSKTESAFAEATVNGIHLKLFPAKTQGGGQSISIALKADPDPQSEGMRLTLLKISDDQGRNLQNRSNGWGGGSYQFDFPSPRNAKSLNLTIALQKSRFVEFTAKPQKASDASVP